MGTAIPRILRRWFLALVAVCCGWTVSVLCFMLISLPGSMRNLLQGWASGMLVWAIAVAAFCLAAWVVVGLPLAIWNPSLRTPLRRAIAVGVVGVLGVAMVSIFLRSAFTFHSVFAFVAASVSMAAYAFFVRKDASPRQQSPFSSDSP